MLNHEIMTLKLTRLEICDLMIACTGIVCDSKTEQRMEETSEERKRILDGTIRKWQTLHDKIEEQFDEQDEKN